MMTLRELLTLRINEIRRSLMSWWLTKVEEHYNICADTEEARARGYNKSAGYYRKQAALARSYRASLSNWNKSNDRRKVARKLECDGY